MSATYTLVFMICCLKLISLCFISSTGVLLTFVCNDRMSDTVDELEITSNGIINEAISFVNRTVGVSLTHYCRAVKNDILTISGYKIFFSTNIYSSKLCNISFETAQNMLYRKK